MKKRSEIFVHPIHRKEIAKEFDTTLQTVRMALKYVNNSSLGKRIRTRAIELLRLEAKKAAV